MLPYFCRLGLALGPLFLLYNIPQVLSNTYTYLYVDDTGIFYQHKNHKDIAEIENVLNKEFVNICNWFVDNKTKNSFW